jgi:hypothetical protein
MTMRSAAACSNSVGNTSSSTVARWSARSICRSTLPTGRLRRGSGVHTRWLFRPERGLGAGLGYRGLCRNRGLCRLVVGLSRSITLLRHRHLTGAADRAGGDSCQVASGPVPARALPARKLSTSPSSVGFWIAGITHLQPHRIARLGIAYAVQEQALFADLSIRDNLQLGLVKESVFDERLSEIEPVFPVFKTRLKQYAGTLSGGEQKMLLVARSLTMRPSIILLDEIS